jgi:crotonobetainyl-CoA:carnitine CoA-transferase CaiB-like acyl-CoA transferase
MCSISGYGQTGPNTNHLAFATVIHAASGVTEILRQLHGKNIRPAAHGISWGDTIAGYHAAYAIMASLFHRERTGTGQYIDISMFDSLFFTIDHHVQYYLMTNEQNPIFGFIPIKGKDGYLNIGLGKYEMILRLLDCIGRPELAKDERFKNMARIIENQMDFFEILESWIQGFDSEEEAENILRKAGLEASKVRSIVEVIHSSQVESRRLLTEVNHPKIGKVKSINSLLKFLETESKLRGLPPELGEHNREILSKILHYTDEQIGNLYHEKILFSVPQNQ